MLRSKVKLRAAETLFPVSHKHMTYHTQPVNNPETIPLDEESEKHFSKYVVSVRFSYLLHH